MSSIITKILRFCIYAIVLFTINSCTKEKKSNIPYAYVNLNIILSDIEFIDLQSIGGKVMVSGGVNGIIIYRSGIDEFLAYDRSCSFEPNTTCRVSNDTDNIVLVKCDCCESKYEINFGAVSEGPAQFPLREYNTTYNGGDLLLVHN